MAYLVLARKWRPQRFEDVVGQEHVTTTLRNAIAQGRIAHAFLFSGPRGVGKTTVARLLAKALNCVEGPTGEPCGVCPSCLEVTNGSALDVVEIDGASNTGVDNIRDLNEGVRYRPASSRFKVYIIDEVHMLSTAAFNALLKTLEEPPEHVKFIFATTEVQRLPPTVVSRCQRYEFKRIPTAELIDRLRRITTDEGLTVDDAALFDLAREADGSMRDAQSLLDQVIVSAGKTIGVAEVRAALGVADRTILHQVTDAILTRDAGRCLHAVDELHRHGYEVLQFCRDLVRQMRNLTVAAFFHDATLLADLPDNEVQETVRQARLRSADDLQRLFRLAHMGADEVRRSPVPVLALEMTLVKMATMPDAAPVAELVSRLEELERRLAGGGGAGPGRGRDSGPTGGGDRPPSRVAAPPSPPVRGGRMAADEPTAVATVTAPADVGPARASSRVAAVEAALDVVRAHGAESGGGWPAFLAAAQAKISLRVCLTGSRVVEETDDTLHLGVENEFALVTLQHADNVQLLQDIAARCYGGPRRVKVSVVKPPAEEVAERLAAEETKRRALQEQARASPTVRAAIDVLGGEVTEVRPRSRGGSA